MDKKKKIRIALIVLGIVAVIVAAVVVILFTREKPPVAPPGPVAEKEDFSLASI